MGFQENSQEKDKIKVEWDEEIASPSKSPNRGKSQLDKDNVPRHGQIHYLLKSPELEETQR